LSASRTALAQGWDFATATDLNAITGINITSIVTGLLAPLLSRALHLNLVWIYKAILPLFLVAVPVVMYQVFRKQIGDKRAFYAALFFIVMPVYSLQLAQIVKSMVAELLFAVGLLAMVSNWREWRKGVVLAGCTVLALMSHYTIGLAMLSYLLGILVVRKVTSRLNWSLWAVKRTSVITLATILLLGSSAFYVYYHYAYGGAVNQVIGGIARWHGTGALTYTGQVIESAGQAIETLTVPPTTDNQTTTPTPANPVVPQQPKQESYLHGQEYLVQVGIGLDFFDQPIDGKLFRVIQYLTQLLIVVGTGWLLLQHKRYTFTAEFVAGIGCSFVLLLACIFVPQFSSIINMPRFYQISLFFLAPVLVLGCDALSSIQFHRKGSRRIDTR
jgi:uncharacterized membrane protein